MNSDTPKEGVVIDATPEPDETHADTPASEAEQPKDSAPKGGGRGIAAFALLVALLAIGLIAAGGWYGYRQLQAVNAELANARSQGGSAASEARNLGKRVDELAGSQQQQGDRLSELKTTLSQVSGDVAEVQRRFGEEQQQMTRERALLDERESALRSLVNGLNERVGRSGSQWLVAEADYLVRLAEHRLSLAADPDTARTALKLADERLRATGDPSWAGVRAQLARDITALDTLEQPDITGLWSRLGALAEQVPKLKLNDDPRRVTGGKAPPLSLSSSDEGERTWRTVLSDLWQGIKNAVRIRRNDEPVAAMLPPEQSYFLYENLRLKLQQARLALLQGRAEVYHQSIAQARDWLAGNFQADAVSRGLDAALAQAADAKVKVDLPDISGSVRALQARRALLEQSQPAPQPSAAKEAPPA